MTNGLLSVGSSALGVLAVGVALLTIEPLFFALGVVAAVPLILTSLRVGRALYRFAVEQTPTDRQRNYIQLLLVDKDPAKEIRAYQLGGYLRARFAALYEGRIQALRQLVRRAQRPGRGRRGAHGDRFGSRPRPAHPLRVRWPCVPGRCGGRRRRLDPLGHPAPGPGLRAGPALRERPVHPGLQQLRGARLRGPASSPARPLLRPRSATCACGTSPSRTRAGANRACSG